MMGKGVRVHVFPENETSEVVVRFGYFFPIPTETVSGEMVTGIGVGSKRLPPRVVKFFYQDPESVNLSLGIVLLFSRDQKFD
jgi:hypothetical protein